MKNVALMVSALSLSILFVSAYASTDEKVTLNAAGKSLQTVINDLAREYHIEFENAGLLGKERLEVELTDTLNNLVSRLLKGYNHVIRYDREGRIQSVTVISPRIADNSFDESILPTGELMQEEN